METPETIRIDDVTYMRVNHGTDPVGYTPAAPKVILVLQRGWVVVGEIASEDADTVVLRNAFVIRKWGTTKGLGQLALEGPQSATVLDPCGWVQAHPRAVVMRIPCEASKWI